MYNFASRLNGDDAVRVYVMMMLTMMLMMMLLPMMMAVSLPCELMLMNVHGMLFFPDECSINRPAYHFGADRARLVVWCDACVLFVCVYICGSDVWWRQAHPRNGSHQPT